MEAINIGKQNAIVLRVAISRSLISGYTTSSMRSVDVGGNALANTSRINNNTYVGASHKFMKAILPNINAIEPYSSGFRFIQLLLKENGDKYILDINDKNRTKTGNDSTWGCKSPSININKGNSMIV